MEAYSPIAHGKALKIQKIALMAEKYQVSVAQLYPVYDLSFGMITLPKTENPAHMKANTDVEFVISEEDMHLLKHTE